MYSILRRIHRDPNHRSACFRCRAEVWARIHPRCPACTWVVCPRCGACRCARPAEPARRG
jgi:hypothetical protein